QGLFLLGHEHDAEAALADLLQELVRADHGAGPLGDRVVNSCGEAGGRGFATEKVAGPLVRLHQRLDTRAQLASRAAGVIEVGGPLFRSGPLDGLAENRHHQLVRTTHGETPHRSVLLFNAPFRKEMGHANGTKRRNYLELAELSPVNVSKSLARA